MFIRKECIETTEVLANEKSSKPMNAVRLLISY